MLNVATPSDTMQWRKLTLAVVMAVTLYRVVLLWFSRMDLFVDEAQYWLWGQELAFGYYSKPPLIGWVIRAVTDLAGSDAPFWVRLPAPLLHAATAMILGTVAARLWDRRAGFLVAAGYVTLPVVAVGSVQISTDTVLFPFMALALSLYLRVLQGAGARVALLAGVALGVGFLAKYAAVYYLLCAGLAALLIPAARPGWRAAGQGLLGFLVVISPNLIWNVVNGFSTLSHTMDNADWVRDPSLRAGLNFDNLTEFAGAQFAVFGPILMGALLWQVLRCRRWPYGFLQLCSLPIIALVCVQALLANAYANWAASAVLAGTLAVLPWLTRRWLIGSFVINGALCVILPWIAIFADDVKMLERYTGLDEMSRALLDTAHTENLPILVANNRKLLADLKYTGRNDAVEVFSVPADGRPMNHYQQAFPLPETLSGPVLFVGHPYAPPACDIPPTFVRAIQPEAGPYRRDGVGVYRLPARCLRPY